MSIYFRPLAHDFLLPFLFSVCLSVDLLFCLPVLSTCLPACLPICVYVSLYYFYVVDLSLSQFQFWER